jgi:ATPase subunit of ABC transporter with duplicated ATPase domains
MIMAEDNVIALDEPTNHLDLESIEALNYALTVYEGTVIFVSHDREFVSSLATRIIEVTPEGITDYHGTYDEYLEKEGGDFFKRSSGSLAKAK